MLPMPEAFVNSRILEKLGQRGFHWMLHTIVEFPAGTAIALKDYFSDFLRKNTSYEAHPLHLICK